MAGAAAAMNMQAGGIPNQGAQGMPMSQPAAEPAIHKMYVKTTAIESMSTLAATSHISFLWTMLALSGGIAIGLSCGGRGGKKSKKASEKDESSEEDSSSSDSE